MGRFPRSTAVAVLAAGSCAIAASGCGPGRDVAEAAPAPACDAFSAAEAPAGTSLVLVVNDTMRRDRLGAYGGPARTPRFDAFARENLLFLNAASAAPWTKPAVASLFTSLHPSQHGVRSHPEAPWSEGGEGAGGADVLPDAFVTLAEALGRAGFRTAAFVANPWMTRGFGYEQGFEVYDDSFASWEATGDQVVAAGLDWLEDAAPQRFFLYLHMIDGHLPYGVLQPEDLEAARADPDPRPVPAEANQYLTAIRVHDGRPIFYHDVPISLTLIERAYDRGLEAFDDALGALLDAARPGTALGRAAIVVTSDHGEALFEHGYGNHARGLGEEEIGLPLAAKLPGVRPARAEVRCPVGLVDLMASLCVYFGAACPADLAGRSFLPGGDDGSPRYVVSEGVPRFDEHRAIRNRRYKLVYAPHGPNIEELGLPDRKPEGAYALYDLVEDPAETRDLLDGFVLEPGVAAIRDRMRRGLEEAVASRDVPAPVVRPIDPNVKARLRALGYKREPSPDAPAP